VSRYPIIAGVSTSRTQVVLADDDVLLCDWLAGLLERSYCSSRSPGRDATESGSRPNASSRDGWATTHMDTS
jgi:hypothetical protein